MTKKYTKVIGLLWAITTLVGCQQQTASDKETIFVSIAPLKYIVEEIVGSDFQVEVLVPAGASPETFEPTPKQYIALNEAVAVMSVGLIDFEKKLLSNLSHKDRLVELSEGVEVIAGSCAHDHDHHDHGEAEEEHHHHHGIDPHVWTSPIELQRMAQNCYQAIAKIYPDSVQYSQNYQALQLSLEELDNNVTGTLLASGTKSFVIHHPAYTYFARDYGIEQISIQDEGKEPSTRRIGEIIDHVKSENVGVILFQKQFPSSVVDVIAADAGVEAVAVDPLSEDIITHIEEFTTIISNH